MRYTISRQQVCVGFFALCLSNVVSAQNPEADIVSPVEKIAPATAPVMAPSPTKNTSPTDKGSKKMVQEATINLQTTVTGNQEQPRVLYILPWQSPAPEDVDFESLSNEQRVVFGHVEREELRRELESAGEE